MELVSLLILVLVKKTTPERIVRFQYVLDSMLPPHRFAQEMVAVYLLINACACLVTPMLIAMNQYAMDSINLIQTAAQEMVFVTPQTLVSVMMDTMVTIAPNSIVSMLRVIHLVSAVLTEAVLTRILVFVKSCTSAKIVNKQLAMELTPQILVFVHLTVAANTSILACA